MPSARDEPLIPLVVVGDRAALVHGGRTVVGPTTDVVDRAADLERREHPRWAVVSAGSGLARMLAAGVPVARAWDVAEAHRLLFGGWRADPAYAWACLRGLDPAGMPSARDPDSLLDLLDPADEQGAPDADPQGPVAPSGYLRRDAWDPARLSSEVALTRLARWLAGCAGQQRGRLSGIGPRAVATAASESAAAVLAVELERDGLPVDRQVAQRLIAVAAGRRPVDDTDAAAIRRHRDRQVLHHAPGHERTDLRNPAQVKRLLSAVGVDVPTTRAGALEPYRAAYPLVEALLRWRKDERIATTYGYRWLDEHVGADGRLRGGWTACDGAAGRMTAQHGLHNLPTPLRAAVVAEPGHVFVRADLGQVEPRVLAVVSGDPALAAASGADDLYAPVAARLGVARPVAKVAVLAAMYGQRTGAAGAALDQLRGAYPVAMGVLDEAYRAGVQRRPMRTFGGRRLPLDDALPPPPDVSAAGLAALDAARGRYARNAVIQGSAAELFKAWAATVRHAMAGSPARIVLCLHDELLVHTPTSQAPEVAEAVGRALVDASRRWAGTDVVRFVADVAVMRSWAEAKAP